MSELLRRYGPAECGPDGYPFAWHLVSGEITEYRDGRIEATPERPPIKDMIREQADNRCQRCGHPYHKGEHGNGEWSLCDIECHHLGPMRYRRTSDGVWLEWRQATAIPDIYDRVEAHWRILTVHHLTGEKADCRWGNLAALCQRCHLTIQKRVKMEQVFPFEHTEWFKPHAAWWYAVTYLGEENPSRESVIERLDDLLALERIA